MNRKSRSLIKMAAIAGVVYVALEFAKNKTGAGPIGGTK